MHWPKCHHAAISPPYHLLIRLDRIECCMESHSEWRAFVPHIRWIKMNSLQTDKFSFEPVPIEINQKRGSVLSLTESRKMRVLCIRLYFLHKKNTFSRPVDVYKIHHNIDRQRQTNLSQEYIRKNCCKAECKWLKIVAHNICAQKSCWKYYLRTSIISR